VSVYRHISAERAHCYAVSLMCEVLGVSEPGYWAWVKRPPSDRELTDMWLTERIRRIHEPVVASTAARACTPSCAGRGSAWAASASSG